MHLVDQAGDYIATTVLSVPGLIFHKDEAYLTMK
jgi:hypothetical protein